MREERGWKASPYQWTTTGYRGAIRSGNTICGALFGGAVACGLIVGEGRDKAPSAESEERKQAWQSVNALFSGFIDNYGDTNCKGLTNTDFSKPEEIKQYIDKKIYKACFGYVRYVIAHCLSLSDSVNLDL